MPHGVAEIDGSQSAPPGFGLIPIWYECMCALRRTSPSEVKLQRPTIFGFTFVFLCLYRYRYLDLRFRLRLASVCYIFCFQSTILCIFLPCLSCFSFTFLWIDCRILEQCCERAAK